ncbi:uncharacterized protein [Venturia canescens]|uniref:uncharacterized protein n=1 Tax=Venturia canescens TaxID=32260 RepID=UPI001C9C1206|nr:uncharacterized protein LOC122416544 [Venturia canescens]
MNDRKTLLDLKAVGSDSKVETIPKNHRDSSDRIDITADYVVTLDHDLHESEKCTNLQETLRLVVLKLKENNWETSVSALLNVVHMSRIQPEMIDSSMPLITRSLHSLMRNVRPQVVRTACQIAEELFKTMQCTQKPEFDQLVGTLLQKTSHMNKAVRQDASRALDAMVVYIPATHCISVMFSCGACHKNPIVRSTVSRLLYDVVRGVGVESFLTMSNLRDSRKKTFSMCLEFLNDASTETRCNARRLLQLLMRHSAFDVIFNQDIDRSLIKKNEKKLVSLKYDQSGVN